MPDAGNIKETIKKITDEMTTQTSQLIGEKLSALQKTVEEVIKSSHIVSVPTASKTDLNELKKTSYILKEAQGQNEIVTAILNFAGNCVQRAAVFALKGRQLYGWQAIGLKADDPSQIVNIKKIVIDATKPSPFLEVIKSRKPWIGKDPKKIKNPILDEIFSKFGGTVPKETCFFPLCIKNRIIAILYGDNITSSQLLFQTDSLEVMSVIASLVLENVSMMRSKGVAPSKQKEAPKKKIKKVIPTPLPEDMDEATRKLHEKAQRTARVIVGDIVLYNKAKIENGIASGNLSAVLREDITKGRDLYHQRVAPEITKNTNYYEETLIKMVAKGDSRLLGI